MPGSDEFQIGGTRCDAGKGLTCEREMAQSPSGQPFDPRAYKARNIIERTIGRLKDWRRIHTRYDRCAHTFMSAICIAATVIFWLPQ